MPSCILLDPNFIYEIHIIYPNMWHINIYNKALRDTMLIGNASGPTAKASHKIKQNLFKIL